MLASEIMTAPVVTIGAATPVREIAALLSQKGISGVPVTDAGGRILGIISEADLMRGAASEPGGTAKWWLTGLASADAMARAYAKAHGRTAADVMTRHVATIRHDAPLAEVADLLVTHGIKRLPVMRDGALVGIITRRDLVRAVATAEAKPGAPLGNAALQKLLLERLAGQAWLDASYIGVEVSNAEVRLTGFVASPDQRRAAETIAGELAGARAVDCRLEVGLPLVSDFA